MLLAVLLSLLPAALPADVRQDPAPQGEPFLQWDGETEDAYRRALHLWQVRGKPGEAADILLKLADSAEVTQVAGQASWVLVHAAQALAEAGRTAEASALIPGIERGARGTPLEAAVQQKVTELRAMPGSDQTPLDQAFLETLIRQLGTYPTGENANAISQATVRDVRKYDRPVLPYLLEIVRIWPESKVEKLAVTSAVRVGLSMADPAFVDELTAILEAQTTLSFITILSSSAYQPMDELAEREVVRFWKGLARHPDSRRRLLAKESLRQLAFDSNSTVAQQAVRDLLGDQDASSDAALLGDYSLIESPADARSKLLVEVALGPDSEASQQARTLLLHYNYLDQLRELAERGGRQDVVRYLACLAATSMPGQMESQDIGGPPAVQRILRNEVTDRGINWSGADEKRREFALKQPRSFEFARPFLADADMRTLLAIAAAGLRDEAGFELAYSFGIPGDEPSICSVLNRQDFLPEAFRSRAAQLLVHPEVGRTAWQLISKKNPEQVSFELMNSSSLAVKNQHLNNAAEILIKRGRSAEALQLTKIRGVEESQLVRIVSNYLQEGDQWWLGINEILDMSFEWKSDSRNYVLQQLCDSLGRLPEVAIPDLNLDQIARMLIEARKAGVFFRSTPLVGIHWDPYGRALMQRLGTSEDVVQWMALGLEGAKTPDFVVYCLREGCPLPSFREIEKSPTQWIPEGAPQLIEASRILLARKDSACTRTALKMMSLAPSLAPALWQEVEFTWSDPALASLTANVLRQTEQRDDYVQKLLEAWKLPGLERRFMMIQAMSSTADPRVAPVLLVSIADPDSIVAGEARVGLQRLKEIEEQRAFWESWQATGVGGSPTAALLKQIQSKNKEVRLSAIRALGAIKAPEALPLLISLLEDPDPEVVAAARAGLAWLQPPAVPK